MFVRRVTGVVLSLALAGGCGGGSQSSSTTVSTEAWAAELASSLPLGLIAESEAACVIAYVAADSRWTREQLETYFIDPPRFGGDSIIEVMTKAFPTCIDPRLVVQIDESDPDLRAIADHIFAKRTEISIEEARCVVGVYLVNGFTLREVYLDLPKDPDVATKAADEAYNACAEPNS